MVMSSGGYIQLDTVWQDIQLVNHHAGSDSTGNPMIDGLVEVTIDAGIDVTWNYTLDSNGELNLLLPVGDFQISLNLQQFSMKECSICNTQVIHLA